MEQDPKDLTLAARGGVRLRFRDCGEGDPAVVFVHGWGCNHLFFGPQVEHFSATKMWPNAV